MGREAIRVRLSTQELGDELIRALAGGDCSCARLGDGTFLVVHHAAADAHEARTELRFFLSAWETLYEPARAELV